MSLIVSLSTIPPRFSDLQPALEGLLRQTAPVDEIRLYIPKAYRRFPDWDGQLPDVPKGINIIQPEEDIGPATKALFAARELAGTDADLIYCDDDRIYHPRWIEQMIAARGPRSDIAVTTSALGQAHRAGILAPSRHGPPPVRARFTDFTQAHMWALLKRKLRQLLTGHIVPKPNGLLRYAKPGFVHVAEGFGAVLVKPDFFDETMFDIPPVLWSVDDIWLSGHLERKGIGILCASGFAIPPTTGAHDQAALASNVFDGADRSEANAACVKYMQETYGIWL
ncbi:hypothetical protein SAMN04488005_0292 [Yoonia tamlensis]|uniref:Glycosyl transferase family 2 n=1 Tax=Yoonia tamlensis TaxID=390270 RepID=A0A1I6FQW3_9RHOB|nr:glycosyltransferase family A protein [Yoonia tamlensis]SFR32341.1 hypothetical protein SAMN04488005_0292 [Yoonia tamlensis]